jgi:hypothetical protein
MALVSKFSKGTAVRKPTMTAPPKPAVAPRPATAPATPGPSALPPDAAYEQTLGNLAQRRDSTIAGLGQQRQQGLLSYGYTESAPGQLAFDPTNPYSQAAMLKRNYDQARTGNTNSYAARGQLYSGALQNAQDESQFREGQASDALQKGLLAFLANNTQDRFTAGSDYNLGAGQALGDAIGRAPSNPAYNPVTSAAAPAVAKATTPAFKAVAGTDSKNNPGVWHIYPDGRKVFVRK